MLQHIKSNRQFLTISEACEKTGLSPRYIQRLLHEERLEGFKASSVWFVYEDSLSTFTAKPRKRGPKGTRHESKQDQSTTPLEAELAEKTYPERRIENATGQETKTAQ